MFRKTLSVFTLLAALVCNAASAQEMDAEYVSTKLDGTKILAGYTVYIDVSYLYTDEYGFEHYVTQSEVVNDLTGMVESIGMPGSLMWNPEARVGSIVGSIGTQGWLFDPVPGSGSFVADYSGAGGNTRVWTRQ